MSASGFNQVQPIFNESDYEIESKDCLYKGFFQLNRYRFRHKKFEGGWTETVSREVFERGHSACVLLFDAKAEQVVLVEQFRCPAVETSESPWQLELVAGMIDEGYEPGDIARKEAKEEAGITINKLVPINDYLASSGGTTERVWLYLGFVDASQAGGVHGLDEEHEDIKVHCIDLDTLKELLNTNKIDNAALLIATQWLFLNLDKIRTNY